jgi:hypothetical protein
VTRRQWAVVWAAFAAMWLVHAWVAEIKHDEVEHLHAAWLMSIGERPFADFLEQHHPTVWLLFAPLCRLVDDPQWLLYATRVFDLLCGAELLVALHRLVKRLVPDAPDAAMWATLLAASSFTFARNMMVVRPDPLMAMLLVVGLEAWVGFVIDGGARRAAWAGLCFGLAIAVLQKAIAIVGLVGAASLVLAVVHRRRALAAGLAVAAGVAAVPVAALVAWMCGLGVWRAFWTWNYDFNRYFYTEATLAEHFSIVDSLSRVVVEDVALWAFGIAGMVAWLRGARRATWTTADDARVILAVALLGYLGALSLNRFPFLQYFVVVVPLWAPFAAPVLARARLARAACFVMLAVCVGFVVDVASNAPERGVQDYVLAHTAPTDTVAMSPPDHPIFRRDASFFWYNGALIGDVYAKYARDRGLPTDILDAWTPPAFVYLDPRYDFYHPYQWQRRAGAFTPTSIPGLLAAPAPAR